MENLEKFVRQLVSSLGFDDFKVETDPEHRHGVVFIYSHEQLVKENLPVLVECINHLAQLFAHKNGLASVYFDVNNYRKERERIIAELAKTAARKVQATHKEIQLPHMNAYERRIVHMELASHPGVKTESSGAGRERGVTIRPMSE